MSLHVLCEVPEIETWAFVHAKQGLSQLSYILSFRILYCIFGNIHDRA